MGTIPPIGEPDEIHHFENIHRAELHANQSPSKPSSTPKDVEVDHNRLHQDNDYFLQTMKYMLDKARSYYNNFEYAQSKELYEKFFRYFKTYRPKGYNLPIDLYPAIYEHAWIMEIHGDREEAQTFLNHELLHLLEPTLKSGTSKYAPIRETVQELQEQKRFPNSSNFRMVVAPNVLVDLAQRYTVIGDRDTAIHLLHYTEVLSTLDTERVRTTRKRLEAKDSDSRINTTTNLPHGYTAPWVPIPPSTLGIHASELEQQELEIEYRTDKVEPVHAINKDPREQEKRGQRKKRQNGTKSSKSKKKPQITL